MIWDRVGEVLSEKIKEVVLPAFLIGAGAALAVATRQLVREAAQTVRTYGGLKPFFY